MKLISIVNDLSNGDEELKITTYFKMKYGRKVLSCQELELEAYGDTTSFTLTSALLTPAILRQLANEIESSQKQLTI